MDENLKIDIQETRQPRKKKRKKKNYLLRLFLLICFSGLLYLFLSSSIFDIQEFTVENSSYFTKEQIINIAGAKTGGNIFATSTSNMKKNLMIDPYIKNATVSRKLPDIININVVERVEVAYLTYRTDYIIIDKEGIVLRQAAIEPKLTKLEGVTIIKIEPGKPIIVEENAMMTETIGLLNKMDEQEMYFKKILISSVVVKAYIYDSLICQASPEILANNMTQLNEVIYDLYKKGIERGLITMGNDGYFSFSPVPE
jgi:cell division protein FtsQ